MSVIASMALASLIPLIQIATVAIKKIIRSSVLDQVLKSMGMSFLDFYKVTYKKGHFKNYMKVFDNNCNENDQWVLWATYHIGSPN